MEDIFENIIIGIQQTTILEWVAVVFGLLSVFYSMRQNILVYPTGIVSVLIYIYITVNYKLYADMGVNSYYFVMSVYGWYHWKDTKGNADQIPITTNNSRENLITLAILLASFLILSQSLMLTDSDVPYWDATTTSFAIAGMWLMARKKLENWVAWIITDIISVPLYFYKGLMLTSFQFFIFTGLATAGFIVWKRDYDQKKNSDHRSRVYG